MTHTTVAATLAMMSSREIAEWSVYFAALDQARSSGGEQQPATLPGGQVLNLRGL